MKIKFYLELSYLHFWDFIFISCWKYLLKSLKEHEAPVAYFSVSFQSPEFRRTRPSARLLELGTTTGNMSVKSSRKAMLTHSTCSQVDDKIIITVLRFKKS